MARIILRKTTPRKIIRDGISAWSFTRFLNNILLLGSYKIGEEVIEGQVLKEVYFDFEEKKFVDNMLADNSGDLSLTVSED